ncbi:phytanoyl-CoA dioxygenase family protein [Ilumatobacter nonamiensis]|uniref:phytanoyl-CoA dioxygenase family protein n=1 Tax=Ilumatobacter nonamiensis TaxID=467093 RepID=UPI0003461D84|nr:phytanoyl-CoA dioxygenase family protein [Ilumatobacter nonamiensis]
MGTRDGNRYVVTDAEKERFERDGYVHLAGVLTEDEVADLDPVYDAFMRGEIDVTGRDLYDMVSGEFGTDPSEYAIFNVMLPRKYHEAWQGNIFEQVGHTIAEQLCGEGMTLDFDQLLAKQPGRDDAIFAWHQDQAYWINTDDRRTATCWLAIDDSTVENGCMQFLPGSHLEPVRPHRPAGASREEQHTLVTDLREDDHPVEVPIRRGDITVHNEGIMHGSGGNVSASSRRRAYINAYRSIETVRRERELGFTHSHNDDQTVLNQVDGLLATE